MEEDYFVALDLQVMMMLQQQGNEQEEQSQLMLETFWKEMKETLRELVSLPLS